MHTSIGLHILIQPMRRGDQFPEDHHASIIDAAHQAAIMYECPMQEMQVLRDHIHVLVLANVETQASDFIHALMDGIGGVMQRSEPDFQLSEDVHVTLLPPWHIEILASFIRDQERFHRTRSVEDELDLVFRPNALPKAETASEGSAAYQKFH